MVAEDMRPSSASRNSASGAAEKWDDSAGDIAKLVLWRIKETVRG